MNDAYTGEGGGKPGNPQDLAVLDQVYEHGLDDICTLSLLVTNRTAQLRHQGASVENRMRTDHSVNDGVRSCS